MIFIGRKRELDELNALYSSGKFEFVLMYGKRRVGKTALINCFIGDKKAVYFTGTESNAKQNLENLGKSITEYAGKEIRFDSFLSALEYVFGLARKERLILFIDDYTRITDPAKDFAEALQLLTDKYKDRSRLMLILSTSEKSCMDYRDLAYNSALFGRTTAQLRLFPFEFEEACRYLERFSDDDKALLYGALGGTPRYLTQTDPKLSFEENIKKIYLDPDSFLYEEPLELLRHEVREPSIYTAVLRAVAHGASRMSDISKMTGESTNVCSGYLKTLVNLGILRREIPYEKEISRKAEYFFEDNMLRFWYRFVFDNIPLIARGSADTVYSRIKPFLAEYMEEVFTEICRQYMRKLLREGKCPVIFYSLGSWWGKDTAKTKRTKIDIIGEQDRFTALFADCRWTDKPLGPEVIEDLFNKCNIFSYCDVHYYLFSKAGFSFDCITEANALGRVDLVSYKDIIGSFDKSKVPLYFPVYGGNNKN